MQVKEVAVTPANFAHLSSAKADPKPLAGGATVYVAVEFVPIIQKQVFEATFDRNRTIDDLAQEQRQFLKNTPKDLIDVDLPSDNQ